MAVRQVSTEYGTFPAVVVVAVEEYERLTGTPTADRRTTNNEKKS
jgi:hypothetical protein